MNIRLGLQLDGERGWHTKNTLGAITVGTMGMLGILEPQLGLIAEQVSQSQRIVQYLDCLKQCNHKDRFYHLSLETDELGTAVTLLQWRDVWYLNGWEVSSTTKLTGRLSDMAAVEQLARGRVFPSEGERLVSILEVMKRRHPAISKVTLIHPITSFPKRWQQVLSKLPTEISLLTSKAHGDSFLQKLQERLSRVQAGHTFRPEDKLTFEKDDSFIAVRAETHLLASRWFADYVSKSIDDAVLVASDSGAVLDDILVSVGQARHGLNYPSAYRPALQLLPMALALLWAPLDFGVLLAFLSHPISPIRSYARRQLAGKLANQPGIGGESWNQVLAKIDEYYQEDAPEVRIQINTWIDHQRFDSDDGVPIEEVITRTKKLIAYFRPKLASVDVTSRASWNAGYSQTSAFLKALEELHHNGVKVIRQRQLQKLLTETTSRGSSNPNLVAEVGSLAVVSNPVALVENFDEVVWWQPVMPTMPKSYPWSLSERQVLETVGIALPDISETLNQLAGDWLKPIIAANKRIVMILPPNDTEIHPIWQMISAQVDHIEVLELEHVITGDKEIVDSNIVTHLPLPKPKRWWLLPIGTPIPKRGHDSFSGLESYIFNPYHWLLRYPAALKASNILSVSDGFLLDGQLAHRIIEKFFALPNALGMVETDVKAWFDKAFKDVIESEGAILMMLGRRSDYESLRYYLQRALTTLIRQLRSADTLIVDSEVELNGEYIGGKIIGYADLVLTNSVGQQAIVDMKWGGLKKYTDKIKNNSHLQLAIYAELLRQAKGTWPKVGYYILAEAKLITEQGHYYFPDAVRVNKGTEEAVPHLWERFKLSHQWRSRQLEDFLVEVVLESIEETDQSIVPEGCLEAEVLNPSYNDYINLAGWR